jgi:hypothetical protein
MVERLNGYQGSEGEKGGTLAGRPGSKEGALGGRYQKAGPPLAAGSPFAGTASQTCLRLTGLRCSPAFPLDSGAAGGV